MRAAVQSTLAPPDVVRRATPLVCATEQKKFRRRCSLRFGKYVRNFRGVATTEPPTARLWRSMRSAAEWMFGTLVSGREAKQPRGRVFRAAVLRVFEDQSAAVILFVGSTTELRSGAAPLACEPRFPRLPLAEEGDLET
jgi:hypothetical protein